MAIQHSPSSPAARLGRVALLSLALLCRTLALDAPTDLPASLDGSRFLARAWVGTNGPYNLLVDTGASRTLLDPGILEALARSGESTPAKGPGKRVSFLGLQEKKRSHRLGQLRIGPRIWTNIDVLENYLGTLSRTGGTRIDGIAGTDLFRDVRLVLDFPKGILSIEPAGTPLPDGGTTLPLAGDSAVMRVHVDIADRAQSVILDSGYSGSLALAESTAPVEGTPVSANILATAARLTEGRSARLHGDLTLAGLTFHRPIADLLPGDLGLLGVGILRHFTVRIDPVAHVAHLQTRRTEPVTVPGMRSLGFVFSPTPDGLRVEAVLAADATASGLRRGDVISHLDGNPAATTWETNLPELLNSGRDTVQARRVRGGTARAVTLRIATLLE